MEEKGRDGDNHGSWQNLSSLIERNEGLLLSTIDNLETFLEIQADCLQSWPWLARNDTGERGQLLRRKLFAVWRDKILGLKEKPDLLEALYEKIFSEQASLSFLSNLEITLSQLPLDRISQEDFFASMSSLVEGLAEKSPVSAIKLLRYVLKLASHYESGSWPKYWLSLSDSLLKIYREDESYYPVILNHAVEGLVVARRLQVPEAFYEAYRDKRLMDCLGQMIYQRFLGPEGDWPRYWVEQLVGGSVEKCLAWLGRLKWVGEVLEAGGAGSEAKAIYRWLLSVANENLPQLVNYRENASASHQEAQLTMLKEKLERVKKTFGESFTQITGALALLARGEGRGYPAGWVIEGWDKRSRLVSWRSALRTALRENTWQSESDTLPNQRYRLLKSCFEDAEKFLGKAPCEYAVILLGSSARSEACAYSDVEWLVVLPVGVTATGIIASYFSGLMQAVGLQLILLEETPQPDGSRFVPCAGGLLVNGLCADKYTPLRMASTLLRPIASHEAILLNSSIAAPGDKGSFLALLQPKIISPVHSVDEALSQLAGQWYPDVIVPLLILDAFYLQGNERLAKAYLSMVTKLLNERVVGEVRLGQLFGLYLLQGLDRMIEGFQGVMRAGEFDTKAWCQVLTTLLKGLALYRGLPLNRVSSQSRLEGLYAEGYISRAIYLAWETSLRMSLRWRNQLHLARQREEDKLVLTVTESSEEIQALQKEIQGIWPILWAECFQPGIQAIQTLVGKAIAERPIPDNLFHAPTLFPRVQLYVASGEPTISHPWSFPPLLNYVYTCPNPRGERWGYTEARQRWEQQWQVLCVVSGSVEQAIQEKESFQVKVSWLAESGRIQHGWVKREVLSQLLDEKGEFDAKKRINLEGRRIALPIRDTAGVIIAYAKAYPELPLVQLGVEDLSWRLSGYGHLSSLVKFTVQSGGNEKTYPVLLSRYVGPSLQTRLRESGPGGLEAAVNRLDKHYFTLKALETYVISPGDDKLDNLAEEVYESGSGEKRGRWVSIDADHPFESVVFGSGEQEKVGLRSVVYCLVERMEEGISKRIQVEWGQLDIESLLRSWLERMQQLSQWMLGREEVLGEKLFESAELIRWVVDKESLFSGWGGSRENERFSCVGFLLEPGMLAGLYQRLRRLQQCLQDSEITTLRGGLAYLLPRLMVHYEKARRLHPDRLDNCFHALPTDYAIVVEETAHGRMQRGQTTMSARQQVMRALSVMPAQPVKRSLTWVRQHQGLRQAMVQGTLVGVSSALTRELPQVHAFYQQLDSQLRGLQSSSLRVLDRLIQAPGQSFVLEAVLSRLVWSELGGVSNPQQSQILGVQICQRLVGARLQRLLLRDCSVLNDELLLKLVTGMPELVEVDISGCRQLTDKSLELLQLYVGSKLIRLRAERNAFKQCAPYREIVRNYWLETVEQLHMFEGVRYLSLAQCATLKVVKLPRVPMLQVLVVSGCKRLETLQVKAKTLKLVAASCSQLNWNLLQLWWQDSTGIVELSLPESTQLGLTDDDRRVLEDYPVLLDLAADVAERWVNHYRLVEKQCLKEGSLGDNLQQRLPAIVYQELRKELVQLLKLLSRSEQVLVQRLKYQSGVFASWPREAVQSVRKLKVGSDAVVAALLNLLGSHDWVARAAAAESLGKLKAGSDAVVAALLALLKEHKYSWWTERRAAAVSLGKIRSNSKAVVIGLLQSLRDTDKDVRAAATVSLKKIEGYSEVVMTGLLKLLEDKDWRAREAAAVSLGQVEANFEAVMAGLLKVLKDEDQDVRAAALVTLEQVKVGSQVMDNLLWLVRKKDWRARVIAAKGLGQVRVVSKSVVIWLLELVKDEDQDVRAVAAASLGQLGVASEMVLAGLLGLLNDKYWGVRRGAAKSLAQLLVASERLVVKLWETLKKKDARMASAIMPNLVPWSVTLEAVLEKLLVLLDNNDESWRVRSIIAENLAPLCIASETMVAGLCKLLKDEKWEIRAAGLKSLSQTRTASRAMIDLLLKMLKDEKWEVRLAAVESLEDMKSEVFSKAFKAACKGVKDKNRKVQLEAVKSLKWLEVNLHELIADIVRVEYMYSDRASLLEGLKNENSDVRLKTVENLDLMVKYKLRSITSLPSLVLALLPLLKDVSHKVRQNTILVLSRLTDVTPSIVTALLETFSSILLTTDEEKIPLDALILFMKLHDKLLAKIVNYRLNQHAILSPNHPISLSAISNLKTLCFRFFWHHDHQHLPNFPASTPFETRQGLAELQPEYQEYCQTQGKHHFN